MSERYRGTLKPNRVTDLSEDLKPNSEQAHRMSLPRDQSTAAPAMDDAEQQMRRALGLYGDAPKSRAEGEGPSSRNGGAAFLQGAHRRRFVQDGEVPVTVVRRDTPDLAHPGAPHPGPTSSRLQRVEAALTAETALRERVERALHEAQATVQALQTKMGHNELAKADAVNASKRYLEDISTLKEQIAVAEERLREAETRASEAEEQLHSLRADLNEERRSRKLAERMLRESREEAAAEVIPSEPEPEQVDRIAPRRGRPPAAHTEAENEPEPVKWWLLPAKAAGKRR
jgi:hypothetical protein